MSLQWQIADSTPLAEIAETVFPQWEPGLHQSFYELVTQFSNGNITNAEEVRETMSSQPGMPNLWRQLCAFVEERMPRFDGVCANRLSKKLNY